MRILKAMAERLRRPIKIIQGEDGTEGDYSTLSLGERDGSGPNFCLIRWAFEFWPCTDLLAKKRAAECVRLEPGWMGTPNIIEAEQARTLGYRYLVGSVAQGSPGRNSWQDATDFIRQCYSRYLGWCKRPTDFVFIADSLTSAAGTVVDGHIRVDGLHLLSKRVYDEGLGQRNGVPGLGSMRTWYLTPK